MDSQRVIYFGEHMDYSKLIDELKQASLFDLYRLRVAITHQLENPQRINEIKSRLRLGQIVTYFDTRENRLIEAEIIKLKQTKVLVKNLHDGGLWNMPFYWINMDNVDTDIGASSGKGVEKSELKVGDTVRYQDRQNRDVYAEVIRLNRKTATVVTTSKGQWRVPYSYLHLIIDGVQSHPNLIEGKIIK